MKLTNTMRTWWVAFIGFALYFGIFLIPKIIPKFGSTSFIFFLGLLLVLILPLLVLFALWSGVALVISSIRKHPMGQRSKKAGQVSLAGLSMFVAFLFLANVLPSPLPTGSYDKKFDQTVWLEPKSADYIDGDITPRQKMLADVIKQLPGKNRTEIENMLGLSLDSSYFKSTGRDLIYVTGPQRDSLFAIDSEWLLIWVDEHGIYKRHAIASD